MKSKLSLAVVVLGLSAVCAPAFSAANYPDTVSNYVASVRKTVNTVDMEAFLAVVKNPQGALLLDVREAAEYADGHVPGTMHISRGLLEFVIYGRLGFPDKPVDLNRKIYVHCASGGRAVLATEALQKIGFKNVTAVTMSYEEWVKKGYPTTK
jgi:rhodanese-related sulfurtransferase